MDEEMRSRVYARVDSAGRIVQIEGEYSLSNLGDLTAEDIHLVEEGEPCDRLNHAQNLYLDGGLMTEDGIYRWKLADNGPVLRSEEELAADRAAIPAPAPSQLDIIEAQVTYTAICTDTLLEV